MHTYSRPIHTHTLTHRHRTDTVGVGGGAQEIERLNKTKPGTQAGIEAEEEDAEDEGKKICGKKRERERATGEEDRVRDCAAQSSMKESKNQFELEQNNYFLISRPCVGSDSDSDSDSVSVSASSQIWLSSIRT